MCSDTMETPSNDCFLFSDQPLSCDMAEMNDISTQNNLDYYLDSYCSSVSRHNTGFEFPEDCKNMSFSELFDQELFSSQENKDCKITIKIENEEKSLQPCYSTVNTEDTTDSHPLIQIEENVPPSSLIKRFVPKRGINRTSIKTTNNCDIQHLIYSPLCETEDLSIDQLLAKNKLSIVKHEPEDVSDTIEQNIVGMEIKPFYSDGSQNTAKANGLSFVNVKDNGLSLSKSSTTKRLGINRTIIKNQQSDIQQLMCNPFCETENVIIDQPLMKFNIPVIKQEPEDVNNIVEQNVVGMEMKPYYFDDSQNTAKANGLSFVNVKDNGLSSLSKSSTTKRQGINRTTIKNQNSDIQQLMRNPFCETEDVIVDQSLLKFKIPVIKQELVDVNTFEQNVVGMEMKPYYFDDSQNITSQTIISRNSTTKHQNIINTSEYYNVDHLIQCKTSKSLGIDQTSAIVSVPVLKCEPEEFSTTVDQNIVEVKIESCSDNLQNTTNIHNFVNINETFIEKIKNCDVNQQLLYSPSCETQNAGIDQMSADVAFPIVKYEPESVDNTIEQNIVEMDIDTEDESLNEFDCINLNNTIIENELITIVKKEDETSNEIPFKNDSVYSQTFKTNNSLTLETEKKKISWEEYRAKREKLRHTDILENKKEVAASSIAFDGIDNEKMEAIIKEFDRNTAEYFLSEKRKIENTKRNINAKRVSNVDVQELKKKRMKIEYIKKLIPSSFASEIAKTSSLMKGNLVEEIENESTSNDIFMSNDKMNVKQTETYGDLVYLKKDKKSQKKGHLSRIHSSRHDLSNKSSRSPSTLSCNHDDYYYRNRADAMQHGRQYGQHVRNTTVPRSNEQKTVVYVGQIPIRFGKRYLYNRFKMFGKIQSLTLHKKPGFRVYYAFVTYSERSEAEYAISHGNNDQNQVQFDIRFGERKQTQTPYYDLDNEWLTDWYGYNNQHSTIVRKPQCPERDVSFEEELQEFYKLAQIKKLNQIKSSQVS